MFYPFFCIVLSFVFLNANTVLQKWKSNIFRIFFCVMLLGTLVFLVPPFIPQTADLPFIGLKCATLILIGSTMIYAFLKYSNYKIYIFVFFVFLMRIGFNFTYLSALVVESDQLIYSDHVKTVLEITKDEPVHWYGVPHTYYEPVRSSGLFVFEDVKITTAPLMPYQIPYYITKGNQHILKFDTNFRPNQFYMAHTDYLKDKPVNVLYSFPDKWLQKQVVLFKTNAE